MFESYSVENFDEIMSNDYPHLMNLHWLICSRDRKKKSNGEYVIAELKALNPFMNYLSIDEEHPTGYDVVLIVDGVLFENMSEDDKTNFIKLLLKTVDYDEKIKIKKFSLLSFNDVTQEEIELYERLQLIAEQIYDTED